jgi:hypothetical protein
MIGGGTPYEATRNCPGGGDDPTYCKEISLQIQTMTAHGGRLFIGGYFAASGHVFDDSSRQWIPMAEGWCWNDLNDCGGTRMRDMVGLGDTIYAAGNRFIMKFPMSDLPKLTPELAKSLNWPSDTNWRQNILRKPNPPNR